MTTTQGGRANSTGSTLEWFAESTLANKGFAVVNNKEVKGEVSEFGDEVLVKHVPYTSLYGSPSRSEFVIHTQQTSPSPIRIECKWQQSSGSVDEKLPFTYLSAIDAHPEDWVIILIDGGGFRAGALEWLREAAKNRRYIPEDRPEKRVDVMGMAEFLTWANHTFN